MSYGFVGMKETEVSKDHDERAQGGGERGGRYGSAFCHCESQRLIFVFFVGGGDGGGCGLNTR